MPHRQTRLPLIEFVDMQIIVLNGPPAAGKLTVARSISTLTGYGVLHNHLTFDLAKVIYSPEDPRFFPFCAELRLRMVREAAEHAIGGLILTCVYATNSRNDERFVRDLLRLAGSTDSHAHFVHITCNAYELERRVTGPDRHALGKPATVETLREYLQRWEVLNPIPFVSSFKVDTTTITPSEAALQIVSHFHLPISQ